MLIGHARQFIILSSSLLCAICVLCGESLRVELIAFEPELEVVVVAQLRPQCLQAADQLVDLRRRRERDRHGEVPRRLAILDILLLQLVTTEDTEDTEDTEK